MAAEVDADGKRLYREPVHRVQPSVIAGHRAQRLSPEADDLGSEREMP